MTRRISSAVTLLSIIVLMNSARAVLAAPPDDKAQKDELLWILGSGPQGVARFETADKSAKLGFLSRSSAKSTVFGASLKGAVENDLGTVFNGGNLAPKAQVTTRLGWSNITTDRKDSTSGVDWVVLSARGTGAKLVLVDTSAVFEKQVKKSVFTGFGAEVRYARFFKERGLIVSVFGGCERDNNYAKLDEVEITTETMTTDSATHATRRVQTKLAGRAGGYRELTIAPVGIELFHKTPELLGIGLSATAKMAKSNRPKYDIAGGLYLLKESTPSQSVVGIVIGAEDVGHGDARDQLSVGIVLNIGIGH